MGVSVTNPISESLSRTSRMLFKPFDATKWFTLGFCAFLATLGEGGGSGGANFNVGGRGPAGRGPGTGGGTSLPQIIDDVFQFIVSNLYWIVPVGVVMLAIYVVVLWLRARGKFMFLDGVARNRADVVEPWKRLRAEAKSYFWFELALAATLLVIIVGTASVAYLVALPDIRAQRWGSGAVLAIALGGGAIVLASLGYALAKALAEDFLIPLMYLRSQPIAPAWREFRRAILPGNGGSFVLFYLMRILLGFVSGMIMLLGMCLTCCIAAIPYISAVVFLPILVFHRCYSLYFLRQIGYEYNVIVEIEPQRVIGFPVVMDPMAPPPIPGQPPSSDGGYSSA